MDSFGDLIFSFPVFIAIAIIFILYKSVVIVPQNMGYVIYTLGKYSGTQNAGLNFIVPFYQKIVSKQNLKEQSLSIHSQSAITKDNVTLEIDGILYIKVVDAAAATNNIENYQMAVVQLAMTTMRSAIGSLELDECFQNREKINAHILTAMTEATQPWGVQVTRYEIRDITPPMSIKEDMEKQMSAEREKRSVILTAEGVKTSAITEAEGLKQARVLDAEAAKAEQVLAAEAEREAQILAAQGKAEAIRLVADAEAQALGIIGRVAYTKEGVKAVELDLATKAIDAHKAIADQGSVILSDGNTGGNVANTVAQAVAISKAIHEDKS